MTPGARAAAAIEVLTEIEARKRPAAEALKDWGVAHRFAGSGDRAAIGNLVFDALRKRASSTFVMGEDSPRALVLHTLTASWHMSPEAVAAIIDGAGHAPPPLSEAERAALERELPDDAPPHVKGDYPEWLQPEFDRAFGARAAAEGAALARRAPVDLRVNTLKAGRDKVLKALRRFEPEPAPLSPLGVRVTQAPGPGKSPHVEAEPGHGKGWFEVQDEGSQLATLLAGAKPRQQVLDLCAGAGGKTLALSALMENSGQLYAYDADRMRLRPIFERLKRAGARNVQVLQAGDREALAKLEGKLDLVLIDAPCSGSGVWRRRPDAKWRLSPQMLEARRAAQTSVLEEGAGLVKQGGRLAYITCSVLPSENRDQVDAFLTRHPDFKLVPWPELWQAALPAVAPIPSAAGSAETLQMTPLSHGTDGFFVAVMQRSGDRLPELWRRRRPDKKVVA
jgi:16S rRNA (cytosine967-C5)-methyltransferase